MKKQVSNYDKSICFFAGICKNQIYMNLNLWKFHPCNLYKIRSVNQLYLSSVGGFGKGSCSDQGFQVVIPFEVLLQSTVSFGTVYCIYIYIPYICQQYIQIKIYISNTNKINSIHFLLGD